MRKYRAKETDHNEWVYGYPIKKNRNYYLFENNGQENKIDPNTLGQYIGIIDVNDTQIYECDIIEVNYKHDIYGINGVTPDQDCFCIGVVEYSEEYLAYELRILSSEDSSIIVGNYEEINIFDLTEAKILGNIYDIDQNKFISYYKRSND